MWGVGNVDKKQKGIPAHFCETLKAGRDWSPAADAEQGRIWEPLVHGSEGDFTSSVVP